MLDISPQELSIIKSILHDQLKNKIVWAFGSRVTGQARSASDLDLVIFAENNLNLGELSNLKEAFSLSDLPYRVDISEWNNLEAWLQKKILTQHEIIQTVELKEGITMLTESLIWQQLIKQQQSLSQQKIIDFFKAEPKRAENFSIEAAGIFLDYSKNIMDSNTLKLLLNLAEEAELKSKIEKLFSGERVNTTENRPALHTALRQQTNILPEIRATQEKMRIISDKIRKQKWLGATGKPITDVVNIGIGGSDLGPVLAVQALEKYLPENLHLHFISNIDASLLVKLLAELNPETTLFIVASKTFTTIETLTNADTAKQWLIKKLGNNATQQHFLAISASPNKAEAYGISSENILPFWDWVGGRYSLWSAIGLPIAIAIGMENFTDFLAGAHAMDEHFRHAPLEQNMPVILGLLGIWYINFFHAHTHAIIPYTELLRSLASYVQQLDMESNGKSVTLNGEKINYHTAPIIWGAVGTNSQHSVHQLLHQGTELVPIDFILLLKAGHDLQNHQDILVANCLAQAQALMIGRDEKELAKYKIIAGNKPSNMLLLTELTSYTLGALLALYEHKVFVQGVIWNINSFDQWGVELGKQLGTKILAAMDGKADESLDASTKQLLEKYQSANG